MQLGSLFWIQEARRPITAWIDHCTFLVHLTSTGRPEHLQQTPDCPHLILLD